MKTLIELYDERAIENVLGPEMFEAEQVVYLCPKEAIEDKRWQAKLREYYAHRGLDITLEFVESSLYKTDLIRASLHRIIASHPDCAIDITGGNDATLFAAGMVCSETGTPAFTYSRRKNRFYDITNAPFANARICDLNYRVEDFFLMAGGTLRKGRVDNRVLHNYMDKYDRFFQIFLEHRREWNDAITFLTRISQNHHDEEVWLTCDGAYLQKAERGGRVAANEPLLKKLEKLGFLHELDIIPDENVSFTFEDAQIRAWLRDVGSVLELYMYKVCCDLGIFHDVVSSAIVDWDGTNNHDSVSNEIDVVATRGTIPIFISCKATEIKTEALNELAILADRFGGKGAKAAIVTTERCNAATRHRAAQLGIAVIDLEELEAGKAGERLRIIMKA